MSLRNCKIFFNKEIFNLYNKKSCCLVPSKLISQTVNETVELQREAAQASSHFFINKERLYCRNFIESQTSLPLQWKNLEENLNGMRSSNIRSTILRSCQVLEKGDLALDYCQYLINKGEKLSLIETCLLIKVLDKHKSNFKKYEKLIKTIFDHSQDTLFAIEAVVKEAMQVFCQNYSCFKELVLKYKKGEMHPAGVEKIIGAAFDFNDPTLAWEIANENPEKFSSSVTESYLKFCIRLAEQSKFSVKLINDLVDFSKTHLVVIKSDNFYNYIKELTNVLNNIETEKYLWSANKCNTVNTLICSSCQYKFKSETVTADELENLKENFLKKVIISYNINMKTTPKELEKFLIFLENCRPFDIVIDALNLFSGSLYKKNAAGEKILSYFKIKGMKILLIGKSHFKNFKLFPEIKQDCQVFLTRNDSLDDLFCLYAAMHQGLNTYFCTADFLRDHAKFFDDYTLNYLFHKWQISHQYMIVAPGCRIVHPRYHSDISQSSVVFDKNNNVKEYCWHLSYLNFGQNFRVETPAQWICLRAKLKATTEANG